MMMRCLSFGLVVLGMCGSSHAASFMSKDATCQQYLVYKEIKFHNTSNDVLAGMAVQMYGSQMDDYVPAGTDKEKVMSDVLTKMDAYCPSHPNESVRDLVQRFVLDDING